MKILIETPRLLMRKFTLEDVDAVYEFSTHPEVVKYTGDADIVKTKEDAKKILLKIGLQQVARYHKDGFDVFRYE